ncbi:hypothetical protein LX16_2014 [Stackebrandtia albiflava]|uniref:Uncharacterized protein n=1 Tax=Stackebrandtia albiflava TaxID=406432 RepID=A0A562VEG8_9ACTN|nr:hypothetical protein [Stackebrandtia albiflava]TWJ16286.1 hypothetical protein LX16_2014 [Stackebrandtia albiflava]
METGRPLPGRHEDYEGWCRDCGAYFGVGIRWPCRSARIVGTAARSGGDHS